MKPSRNKEQFIQLISEKLNFATNAQLYFYLKNAKKKGTKIFKEQDDNMLKVKKYCDILSTRIILAVIQYRNHEEIISYPDYCDNSLIDEEREILKKLDMLL